MGWSFGKKQSYELLKSSVLISILIFMISFVITDLTWISSVIAVVGFTLLTLVIFPFYLPKMISYLNVNLHGVEYYDICNWQSRIKLIFNPKSFVLRRIDYHDINDISVITGKKVMDPSIGITSKSGVLITKGDKDSVFVDVSWYDTVDNPTFDRAMIFAQSCI
ncbi:hypothetical protein [Companilactobacillus insicii]|uniref:hypothetical protein n=1 Tax=Companilactobacillus insicii TaxID=1732567 RepID=UPI000F7874D5|nr:hypothetical protein [Companilactobacillus insicii]